MNERSSGRTSRSAHANEQTNLISWRRWLGSRSASIPPFWSAPAAKSKTPFAGDEAPAAPTDQRGWACIEYSCARIRATWAAIAEYWWSSSQFDSKSNFSCLMMWRAR